MAKKKIITKKSEQFLEDYLNNCSPTGFESEGQKMWLDYIKPYIDDSFCRYLRNSSWGDKS